MSYNYILVFLLGIFFSYGQSNISIPDSLSNLKYREDQFYIGANYVLLSSDNNLIRQNDFSNQIHLGFIRDIPMNKKGNFSVGTGLGTSYTQFQSNLDFKTGEILNEKYNSAKYFSLNMPFEIRWRSSDSKSFNFWRIYLGTQIQYNFISDRNSALKKITTVSNINFGYNTWNFSLGYDLTPRLIDSKNNQFDQFNLLTVGLIFYFL